MNTLRKNTIKFFEAMYFPILATLAALFLGGIILVMLGFNPLSAYKSLFLGAFGSWGAVNETLIKAIPLIFTGLSFAIARKCGMINLGAEGQFYAGALAATVVSTIPLPVPYPFHIIITLILGFLGGALYGALVGILKVNFGASELITTIMLNYIAIYFVSFCVTGPLQNPVNKDFPQSAKSLITAQLPRVFEGSRLHYGIFVALLAILFYHIFLSKTTAGYELKVVGMNPDAAKYAGININKNTIKAMFLAGGFAGLGGCIELIGIQFILRQNFSNNYGFDGIAVALLGANNPIGIFVSSILFAMLRSGSNKMQMLDKVPSPAIYMIQGMIILFVVGREIFNYKNKKAKNKKGGKK